MTGKTTLFRSVQVEDALIEKYCKKVEHGDAYITKKSGKSIQFIWKKNVLVHQSVVESGVKISQVVVSSNFQGVSTEGSAGHLGRGKIYARTSETFYWPGMA